MIVEVCPEIEQLVFEIRRRPNNVRPKYSRRIVPFCCDLRYVAFKAAQAVPATTLPG